MSNEHYYHINKMCVCGLLERSWCARVNEVEERKTLMHGAPVQI